MKQLNTQRGIMIFLFVLSTCLSLIRLDQTSFWDDEAQVGIIARNYLATGHLTAWDGRNLFAYHNGVLLDAHLRPINPPMDYLITAAWFHLFGVSTWAARFPFVLFGLASLVLFALILKRDFPKNPTLQTYAFGLMALSTVFLLNIRTCRYYAAALFFSQLTFYAYRRCLDSKRSVDFLLLSFGAICLFYSSYLLGAAFLLALTTAHLTLHRKEFDRAAWIKLGFAIVVFCLAVGPYAVHYRIWHRSDFVLESPSYFGKFELFCENLENLNEIGCLPWLAQVILVVFVLRSRSNHPFIQTSREWALLSIGYVFFLCLLLPQLMTDVRYLFPAIPFCFGLLGLLLWYAHQRVKALGVGLFLVLILSNLFSLNQLNTHFRWLLPSYFKEITHPYPTANRVVSDYLLQNAKQDDTVYADPDYLAYPLMFYAGSKVRFCCLLDKTSAVPREAINALHIPIYKEENRPDWIVSFGKDQFAFGIHQDTEALLSYFSRPGQSSYRLVKVLPIYWSQTQRPELAWHSFGPYRHFDPNTEAVYLYHREPPLKVLTAKPFSRQDKGVQKEDETRKPKEQ